MHASAQSASASPADTALLLAWSRSGDEAAFAQLVARHAGMVLATALRKTARPALAEEVAQAVFALAARRAGKLSDHPCLAAWLHRTAVFEAANALRREQQHQRIHAAMATNPDIFRDTDDAGSPGNLEAAMPLLDDALDALPEHDRLAVLLRYSEKLSYDQMGARLGKSADACQKQTSRAVERLRAVMRRRGASVSVLAAGTLLSAGLTHPVSAATAANITAAALSAAPKLGWLALLHHILQTMNTGKQIISAAAIVVLLAAVPAGLQWSQASALRAELVRPVPAGPARRAQDAATATPMRGRLVPPGCSAEEAENIVNFLRGLRGRLLTTDQYLAVAAQIMSLPLSHMDEAAAVLAELPGILPSAPLRFMLYARWGELDPHAAHDAVAKSNDSVIPGIAFMAVASGWMEADPRGMVQWIRDNPGRGANLSTFLGTQIGTLDRDTVMLLKDVAPPGYYPGKLVLAWEAKQEGGNIAGTAHELLTTLPDDHRRETVVEDTARYLSDTDPKAALEFVMSHPDPRGKLAERALDIAAQAWAEEDLDAAAGWALSLPTEKQHLGSRVWHMLALQDEARIREVLSRVPDETFRNSMLASAAAMGAATDPERSMRLLTGLPDDLRHGAISNIAHERATTALSGTGDWINAMPEGPDRDAAVFGFVRELEKSDAESAAIWAASTASGEKRAAALRSIAGAWLKTAPEDAQRWVQSADSLTPEERAAFTAPATQKP